MDDVAAPKLPGGMNAESLIKKESQSCSTTIVAFKSLNGALYPDGMCNGGAYSHDLDDTVPQPSCGRFVLWGKPGGRFEKPPPQHLRRVSQEDINDDVAFNSGCFFPTRRHSTACTACSKASSHCSESTCGAGRLDDSRPSPSLPRAGFDAIENALNVEAARLRVLEAALSLMEAQQVVDALRLREEDKIGRDDLGRPGRGKRWVARKNTKARDGNSGGKGDGEGGMKRIMSEQKAVQKKTKNEARKKTRKTKFKATGPGGVTGRAKRGWWKIHWKRRSKEHLGLEVDGKTKLVSDFGIKTKSSGIVQSESWTSDLNGCRNNNKELGSKSEIHETGKGAAGSEGRGDSLLERGEKRFMQDFYGDVAGGSSAVSGEPIVPSGTSQWSISGYWNSSLQIFSRAARRAGQSLGVGLNKRSAGLTESASRRLYTKVAASLKTPEALR